MTARLLAPFIALLVCLPQTLWGHDARPVFVQITETASDRFDVHWKVPVSVPEYALPAPVMPDNCEPTTAGLRGKAADAYTVRQSFACEGGLSGATLGIAYPNNNPGLSTLMRISLLSGAQYSHILQPEQHQWQVPEKESFLQVARQYTELGVEHIFLGVDHLLFVACLLFIAATPRRIIITISGFTVAHSLTLALAALDVVRVPVPPVEAAIALSIVFLAHEIAVGNQRSWTWRYPLLVSSSFGLLHGFGFASVLADIGLPQTELATGLLFFNVGVEIGQVLFIALLLALAAIAGRVLAMHRDDVLAHRGSVAVSSYAIGIVASYWLVERIAGF